MGKVRYAARSPEELAARRARPSSAGIWSTILVATYETDPEVVAAILPPPLEPAEEPLVRVSIASVDLGNGMPPFGAGTFALRARHGAVVGNYPLVMPMTSEQAVLGGRETFGEPKKLAEIAIEESGDSVSGWFRRMEATFVTIEGRRTGELPCPEPEERIDFYVKAFPSPDGKGFDAEPALVYCYRREETEWIASIDGRVVLVESPFDPVADLPVRRCRSITLARSRSSQRGEIVERIPTEIFEPFLHQRYDDPVKAG